MSIGVRSGTGLLKAGDNVKDSRPTMSPRDAHALCIDLKAQRPLVLPQGRGHAMFAEGDGGWASRRWVHVEPWLWREGARRVEG
jgi:hypothetical protein